MRAAALIVVASVLLAGSVASAAPVPPSGTLDLGADADAAFAGEAAGDQAGWAVASAGDVNGDAKPDLLVAAPKADPAGRTDAGKVYVIFGPVGGLPKKLGDLGARGFQIIGAAAGDRAGTAVAAAGDVNGDGLGDILVGAPRVADSGAEGAGAAYLVYGRTGIDTVDLAAASPAVTRLTTGVEGDQAGIAVGAAPDMDGDRRPEPLIGAARADAGGRPDAGSVFVLFSTKAAGDANLAALGDRGVRIDGPAGARAGLALAGVGDMNGDGRGEIAVGAPAVRSADGKRTPGAGYVVFGRGEPGRVDLAALGGQGFAVAAGAEDRFFGLGVAGLGDMTGDGVPDVAFGAPGADRNERRQSGSVHVIAGKANADAVTAAAFRIDGAAEGDGLGASVAAAGDVNADGLADLAAAAPFADALSRDDAGSVFVVLGSKTPENVDGASTGAAAYRVAGAAAGGLLRSVAGVGDVDGDGAADLLAGAHGTRASDDQSARGPGAAYLVLGPHPVTPPPPDPGVAEEVQAGCAAADNVEMLIDDSGSMEDSDPQLLRRRATELMIAKPRNQGEVLGAYEFGTDGDQVFAPQEILPRGEDSNQPALFKRLEEALQADNGSTNYNAAFTGVANDDPAADARIFITDGEHNEGEYAEGHRGGPPTYVIGLNIGTRGEAARRLRRIAGETKARYFPNVTAQNMEAVINRIDSRLNCDVELDSDVDTLTGEEPVGEQDAELDPDAHAYDIDVMWGDDDDTVVPEKVELMGAGGRAVARLGSRRLRRVLSRPGTTFRFGSLRIRGSRRATFFSVRLSGARGRRLRVSYRMTKFEGRGARVTSQVSQSRRRR